MILRVCSHGGPQMKNSVRNQKGRKFNFQFLQTAARKRELNIKARKSLFLIADTALFAFHRTDSNYMEIREITF